MSCVSNKKFQHALSVISYFRELFARWSEPKVLLAFIDFLLYVNANVTEASELCNSITVNLKSDIAAQLHNVSLDKVEEALHVINRTAALYQRMDLNQQIMWEKLMTFLAAVQNHEEVRLIWFLH